MAPVRGQWKKLVASHLLKRSSQVAGVIDQELIVYGGEVQPRQPVNNTVYAIDLLNNDISPCTYLEEIDDHRELPEPRVGSASTTIHADGSLYLFSGRGGSDMRPLAEAGALWRLRGKSDGLQWQKINPNADTSEVPAPRSYHTMTSNNVDTIYLHAGCPATGRLSDLWSFQINTSEWKKLTDAPDPPRGGTSLTYDGGKLYRMNGFDGRTEQGGAIDIYDIESDSWTTTAYTADNTEGPEARSVSCLVAMVIGGRKSLVTFAGERDPSSLGHAGAGKMLADAWLWDIEDRVWSKVDIAGDAPSSRGWFAAAVAHLNGKQVLVVHGGLGEDNERLSDIWQLSFD